MTLAVPVRIVSDTGDVLFHDIDAWVGEATSEDMALLRRAVGPVLDVGCGPGRHVLALAEQGIPALGIDAAPSAADLARSKGVMVLERSVFSDVPGAGRWGSALLLDGNIGIGGDPIRLLRRIHQLLRADGRLLVEAAGPHVQSRSFRARIETDGIATGWFPWARVAITNIPDLAVATGYEVEDVWEGGGRWFTSLRALSSSD